MQRFFWAPADDRVYAVVRIAFAGVALLNLVSLWPDRAAFLSDAGVIDHDIVREHAAWPNLSWFELATSPAAVTFVLLFSAVWMILLLLGVAPRTAAVFVFLWHVSLAARAPLVSTGWDFVLRAFSFLVLISPLGRTWSLPAWLGRGAPGAEALCYGLGLMRLQVLVIYVQTVILKLASPYWQNGEFMAYYLLSHMARWPSATILDHEGLLAVITWIALAVELAIPILLFIRKTRWMGFLLGFLLHAGIMLVSRNLGLFFLAMMMSYLCFLRREDVEKVTRWFARKPAQA